MCTTVRRSLDNNAFGAAPFIILKAISIKLINGALRECAYFFKITLLKRRSRAAPQIFVKLSQHCLQRTNVLRMEEIHQSIRGNAMGCQESSCLLRLQTLARTMAEKKQAILKDLKAELTPRIIKHSFASRRRRRALTKRELSSKKAAEICRMKAQIYTSLLEEALREEEKRVYSIKNDIDLITTEMKDYERRINYLQASNLDCSQTTFCNNNGGSNYNVSPICIKSGWKGSEFGSLNENTLEQLFASKRLF